MEFIDFLENEIDTRLEGSGLRVVVFEGEEDFIAKFTNPGEFIISVSVAKDDHGEVFLALPGVFSFMTEEIDIRAKRMIGMVMYDIYGRHNVYAIHVHEENIRVDTRAGRFYFKYDEFNVSVKKEMQLIDRYMRKPLRKLFWK